MLSAHFPTYFLLPASTTSAVTKVTQIAKIFDKIDTSKKCDQEFYKTVIIWDQTTCQKYVPILMIRYRNNFKKTCPVSREPI